MNKTLLATTAVALFVAGGANAASPTIKIGGYADFQVGATSQEDPFESPLNDAKGAGYPAGVNGNLETGALSRGYNTATDTQLYVDVDGETEAGLKYGAHITLEADVNSPGDVSQRGNNAGKTFLYVESMAGRVEGGATTSVARQFQVGAETLARGAGGIAGDFDRYIDLDGQGGASGGAPAATFYAKPGLVNDVDPFMVDMGLEEEAQTANKVSYITPDIYGLRAGVSFTPDTLERGTEKGFSSEFNGGLPVYSAVYENVVDAGLHYQSQYNGVGVEASATGQIGETEDLAGGGANGRDDLRSYNLGLNMNFAGFELGGSYGRADEMGRVAALGTEADYFTLGGAYVYGPIGASVTYLQSEIENDLAAGRDSEFRNISVGADYQLAPGLVPYVEVNFFETDENTTLTDNEGTVFISGLGLNF